MTPEQQRKMLEAAAKAMQEAGDKNFRNFDVCAHAICLQLGHRRGAITGYWNPLTNPADCAEMCASLGISVLYEHDPYQFLSCFAHNSHDPEIVYYKDHDNSRLKAWMFAATMVAAKTQGYEDA